MQQQTLHASDVLVIKPVGLQITMQSKSDRNAGVSSFSCIYFA